MSVALQYGDVPEEATLDAFAGDSGDNDDSDGPREDGPSDGADEDVVLAAVTSSWAADGGACASCGEPAGRLWEDGGERVCTACKPWTRTGEDPCDQ